MPLLVIGFLAILASSFGLVVVLTSGSPENKTIELRMAVDPKPSQGHERHDAGGSAVVQGNKNQQIWLARRNSGAFRILAQAADAYYAGA